MGDTVQVMERAPGVLPTGTVTLLLADVEGSTRAWERDPAEARLAFAELDLIVDSAVSAHGGVRPVEQGEGDSFVAAFSTASDALACAVEVQRRLAATALRVRIAVHTGEVHLRDEGNYVGAALNRAARLRDAAHGGQVVLSQVAHDLVADRLLDDVSLKDLGSHRLRDLGRPEHVFQLVHQSLPDEFPPLRTLEHVPNNLPVQLTSFVGREPELAVLQKLLGETRMLTLTGPGGCGKTRLALELGARLLDGHSGGVWFVDLAPVDDRRGVPRAVAGALGLREQPGRKVLDMLIDHLKNEDALLLLDNCEHIVGAVADLAEQLLVGCPALTIVATSREQVGVHGETPWLVPSLSVPMDRAANRIDSLHQYEAVQLFIERARTARTDFAVDNDSAPAVAAICHRLDGIPLAIELAAARSRVLNVEQILAGLDDCFRLLTGGARTTVPRQQTLRASVDWSYRLLSDEERALLNRLSVFAGGFTLDAAESVAGADPLDPLEVLDLLQGLLEKSLLVVDMGSTAPRYRVLETIRQYGTEQLSSSDEETAVHQRHLAFYLGLAEAAAPGLESPDVDAWADRLEAERQNLRAAFDLAVGAGDGEAALRFVAALFWFWVVRGHLREGRGMYRRAFELRDGVAAGVQARALAGAAHMCLLQFDQEGTPLARDALVAARQAGDRHTEGRARYLVGWAEGLSDVGVAFANFEEGIAITREESDRWGLAMALSVAGALFVDESEDRTALLEESVAVAEEIGAHYIANSSRYNLARQLAALGRTAECEAQLRAVIAHAREWGDTYSLTMALPDLGWVRAQQGDFDEGLRCVEENVELFRRLRLPWVSQECQAFGCLSLVLNMAGRHEEAVPAAEQAVASARRLGLNDLIGTSLAGLAMSEEALGRVASARGHCDEALALVTRGRSWAVAATKQSVARVLCAQGDQARAVRLAHDALALNASLGVDYLMRGTVYALETLAELSDDAAYATRLLGAMDALLAGAGHVRPPDWVATYDSTVARLRDELGDDGFDEAYAAGAELSLEEAVEYAQRGRGRRGRPRTGWDGLTPTELEVAKLVAEGLSNPQIAERMFVSRKTVTTHLSHVFAKLGISSRAALSAEVTRRGLEGEKET